MRRLEAAAAAADAADAAVRHHHQLLLHRQTSPPPYSTSPPAIINDEITNSLSSDRTYSQLGAEHRVELGGGVVDDLVRSARVRQLLVRPRHVLVSQIHLCNRPTD